MRIILFAAMLLLAQWPTLSMAADNPNVPPKVAEQIRQQNSDLNIDAIRRTPVSGLYEVTIGNAVYYVDQTGKYLISGHLFDTKSKQDLTAARLEDLNRIDWSILPLDKAIVSGDADGLELAVFTDPDCPYCRQFEHALKGIQGVKVYTFLMPLVQLHPDALRKAEAIWCARDRHAALTQVMVENKEISGGGCDTPLNDIATLAAKLNIQGTPTLIARDGRKIGGALPADQLKAWLSRK